MQAAGAKVGVVAYPGAEVLAWVSAVLDAEVTVLRGLRHGGSPWLVRAGDHEVVLRVARAEQAAETATTAAAPRRPGTARPGRPGH